LAELLDTSKKERKKSKTPVQQIVSDLKIKSLKRHKKFIMVS
jgi:hypothetical protein